MKILFTTAGLVLSFVGIWLAFKAYRSTHEEHGQGPLWPAFNRLGNRIKSTVRRLLRRKPPPNIVGLGAAVIAATTATAMGVVSRGPAPTDIPLYKQVRWIERRVALNEAQAAEDRARQQQDTRELKTSIGAVRSQLREVEASHRELIRSVAADTVRLQIASLFFLGFGTVLQAIPNFM
ncbi:hypothetical protein ACFWIW_13935 [Amycolatopsis sp. NPDC058340]|uniref:hypothetical protein n=1 Tax=Amycolatopsis sp. NPDC058340 TaxID=3346453 RepID=UPI0036467209